MTTQEAAIRIAWSRPDLTDRGARTLWGLALTCACFFAVGGAPTSAQCQPCGTTISSGSAGGIWFAANSPYCITTTNLTVTTPLIIEPGVVVKLDPGISIFASSPITAVGTAAAPIVFAPCQPGTRWGQLNIQAPLTQSEFTNCRFEGAGSSALRLIDASPTIMDCEFVDNYQSSVGGAIKADGSLADLIIDGSQFVGNSSASHGGAIHAQMTNGFRLLLTDCYFLQNSANPANAAGSHVGGAVRAQGGAVISSCEFRGNVARSRCAGFACQALGRGGAVFLDVGAARVESCFFRNNTVRAVNPWQIGPTQSYGGGLYLHSGTLALVNSAFVFNHSITSGPSPSRRGSGVYINGGAARVENCTIVRNNNEGIRRAGGTLDIVNSIVWHNAVAQVVGATSLTFSCVQSIAFPNPDGNLPFSPALSGNGTELCDIAITSPSPCINTGDPNPVYDDVCFPPSWNPSPTPADHRNDMGIHGGPGACAWGMHLGTTYCSPAVANSTGLPSVITAWGLGQAAPGCMVLVAEQMPPNAFGYFIASQMQGFVPNPGGSHGPLCLGGNIGRNINQIIIGPSDRILIDLAILPHPSGVPVVVLPGSTWYFQCWHRDSVMGNATSNFTDAVMITFN